MSQTAPQQQQQTSNPQAAQQYLRTKVLTAAPEQLTLMLYDGAVRFGEQARAALEGKKHAEAHHLITRVQKILNELTCGLKRDRAPELCRNLAALYNFAYRRLIHANVNHDVRALDEAMNVLRYQRETWVMAMEQLGQARSTSAPPGSKGLPRLSMTG